MELKSQHLYNKFYRFFSKQWKKFAKKIYNSSLRNVGFQMMVGDRLEMLYDGASNLDRCDGLLLVTIHNFNANSTIASSNDIKRNVLYLLMKQTDNKTTKKKKTVSRKNHRKRKKKKRVLLAEQLDHQKIDQ